MSAAPWGECESCNRAAGLPLPSRGNGFYCPACTVTAVIVDAAQDSLEAEAGPIVGAWAAQWTAAGVPVSELIGIVDALSGAIYNEKYRARHIRGHLARLRREYRAPVFEHQQPDRSELTAADLPELTAYHWADVAHRRDGHSWPYFVDSTGRTHALSSACDTLTVHLPDGDALLIFTGRDRQTDLSRREGFRVPAGLLAQVRADLSGEGRGL